MKKSETSESVKAALPGQVVLDGIQSEMNFSSVVTGGLRSGLVVITGRRGIGKTFLAGHIWDHLVGSQTSPFNPLRWPDDEKDRGRLFVKAQATPWMFDDVICWRRRGEEGRGRLAEMAIESVALEGALVRGFLIFLIGENLPLSPSLEQKAVRIQLKAPWL